MNIALVHEYLNQYGGAERLLQVLTALIPQAPIFTMLYDERMTGGVFRGRRIETTFLQSMPFSKTAHHMYSPFMPMAVEQMDLRAYDVVLSVSASFAKGVIVHPHARHICYCLTPPRFLWDQSHEFLERFRLPWPLSSLSPLALSYLRVWDQQAATRVDTWLAVSQCARARIQKYYRVDARVVYPPVNIDAFPVSDTPGSYWLMVGRLVAYKRFDVAIEAFNRSGLPLVIVGAGVEEGRLRGMARPNISFAGQVDDAKLSELYRQSYGVVFPQEEDFGIVPLEAMASGKPVVAFRAGGALETVVDRITGLFFDTQTPEAIEEAVSRAMNTKWLPHVCRGQAERFSVEKFCAAIQSVIMEQ